MHVWSRHTKYESEMKWIAKTASTATCLKIDASIKNAYIWHFSIKHCTIVDWSLSVWKLKKRGSAKWKGKIAHGCAFSLLHTSSNYNSIIHAPHEHIAKWAATKLRFLP
jgi:hypothetical protein